MHQLHALEPGLLRAKVSHLTIMVLGSPGIYTKSVAIETSRSQNVPISSVSYLIVIYNDLSVLCSTPFRNSSTHLLRLSSRRERRILYGADALRTPSREPA